MARRLFRLIASLPLVLLGTRAAADPCLVYLLPVAGHSHASAVGVSDGWPPRVVGVSHDAANDAIPGVATVWELPRARPCGSAVHGAALPSLSGYPNAWAQDVNERGEVVGLVLRDAPPPGAAGPRTLGVRWRLGTIAAVYPSAPGLPDDPEASTQLNAIASDRAMVGTATGPTLGSHATLLGVPQPLVLDPLRSAWSVSPPGVGRFVVGQDREQGRPAFVHVDGATLRSRVLSPGRQGTGSAYDGVWKEPGVAWVVGQQGPAALRWEVDVRGGISVTEQELPQPEVGRFVPWGVAPSGQVVGERLPTPDDLSQRHALRWTPSRGLQNLNAIVDPDELGTSVLSQARGISDHGVVVGAARHGAGQRAYAYLPDPPPWDIEVSVDAPAEVEQGETLVYGFRLSNHEGYDASPLLCVAWLPTGAIDPAQNPGWVRMDEEVLPTWCTALTLPAHGGTRAELVVEIGRPPMIAVAGLLFPDAPLIFVGLPLPEVVPPRPAVALRWPTPCALVDPAPSLPVVVAAAADDGGGIASVEVLIDGNVVAAAPTGNDREYRAELAGLGRGVHCLRAQAMSEDGATAITPERCFEIRGPEPSYALEILDPPTPDGASEGLEINASGAVVGVGDDRPCRWAPGTACLDQVGRAEAIDDAGVALVGPRLDGTPPGVYLWHPDGALASVGSYSAVQYTRAFDLANGGERIVQVEMPGIGGVIGSEAGGAGVPFVTVSPFSTWPPFARPVIARGGSGGAAVTPTFGDLLSSSQYPQPPYRIAPVYYSPGNAMGLDFLPEDVWGFPAGVSDRGVVVGFVDHGQPPWVRPGASEPWRLPAGALSLDRQAFRWSQDDGLELLEGLGQRSEARDVDVDGVVVGAFRPWLATGDRAFVHACGRASDLNARIAPGSGFELRSANGINESGQITGLAVSTDGLERRRAFRLTPVP